MQKGADHMTKQRRRRNCTRTTKARIRKGIEQLENRVLPGGFLDLLISAAFASQFDLVAEEELEDEERIEQQSSLARISLASERVAPDPLAFLSESDEPTYRTFDKLRLPSIITSDPISISIRDRAFQDLLPSPTDTPISDTPRPGTLHSDVSQPASNWSVANLGAGASAATRGAMPESARVTGTSRYLTQSVHVQAEGEAPAVTTPMCPAVTTPTRRFPRFPDGTIGYINEGDYAHMPFHVSSLTSDHYTVAWGDGSAVEKHGKNV